MVIFDTDILSMFAKIDAISLLKQLFAEKIAITPKIRDEISAPLEKENKEQKRGKAPS